MSGWDVLYSVVRGIPSVAMSFLLVAAVAATVVFIIGFSQHGIDFVRHGFKQTALNSLFEKRFDDLTARMATKDDLKGMATKDDLKGMATKDDIKGMATKDDISRLDAKMDSEIAGLKLELQTIKVNHFGHLKNFLTELTSILVDKEIITNENKARLDNQLRGM
jgi:hypothetical protein